MPWGQLEAALADLNQANKTSRDEHGNVAFEPNCNHSSIVNYNEDTRELELINLDTNNYHYYQENMEITEKEIVPNKENNTENGNGKKRKNRKRTFRRH